MQCTCICNFKKIKGTCTVYTCGSPPPSLSPSLSPLPSLSLPPSPYQCTCVKFIKYISSHLQVVLIVTMKQCPAHAYPSSLSTLLIYWALPEEGEREREGERDRETDRDRQTERERDNKRYQIHCTCTLIQNTITYTCTYFM